MTHTTRLALLPLLAALAAGCGRKDEKVDETPFREALVKYLASGHMEMKPEKFEEIKVNGDSATATVRMATKDSIGYGLKPLWTVSYAKTNDGWRVLKAGQAD
jgi:hypothetical protein